MRKRYLNGFLTPYLIYFESMERVVAVPGLSRAEPERRGDRTAAARNPETPRGNLRLFLGWSEGLRGVRVMLQEATLAKRQGTDDDVARLMAIARAEVESLAADFEDFPRLKRGMNIKALLKRRPHVILVDTRPISRRPGRLPNAGIDKLWLNIEILLRRASESGRHSIPPG